MSSTSDHWVHLISIDFIRFSPSKCSLSALSLPFCSILVNYCDWLIDQCPGSHSPARLSAMPQSHSSRKTAGGVKDKSAAICSETLMLTERAPQKQVPNNHDSLFDHSIMEGLWKKFTWVSSSWPRKRITGSKWAGGSRASRSCRKRMWGCICCFLQVTHD